MKEWSSKWNPFNSDKLMAHVYRWRQIQRGKRIPNPVSMTVDPINKCNLKCIWCNGQYILNKNNAKMSKETLIAIADFVSEWGVETICIAGGGEPLLSEYTSDFIERCSEKGVQTGVVTNGTKIGQHIKALSKCTWVGVSIDSGTPETYKTLKGADKFNQVIFNIKRLVEYSKSINGFLTKKGQGHGVSYKYLLHPGNVQDVFEAAKIAKEIGCRNMHIRPFGEPWNEVGKGTTQFSYSDIKEFREQLTKAYEIEDSNFRVFGITHKFDGDFRRKNDFNHCYAVFIQGVFMPPSGEGNFDYGFCCDRRGDKDLTLYNLKIPKQIIGFWGGKQHWKAFDNIRVKNCPRCTYQPHNIIFEKTIMEENTTYAFI